MDNFVKELPGKHKAEDESTPNVTTTETKTRKYDAFYKGPELLSVKTCSQ